jgi:hypothetical protein
MISEELKTQVFIIRIWSEPREVERKKPLWRGVIEHVPSGEKRYLNDFAAIEAFIIPYLKTMDVGISFKTQIRQCLKR